MNARVEGGRDNITIDIKLGGGRLGKFGLDLNRIERRAFLSTAIKFHVQ